MYVVIQLLAVRRRAVGGAARAGWPVRALLASVLALATTWMMLLGPATESSSFILLAPSLAPSVVQALDTPTFEWRRCLLWGSCAGFLAAVFLGGFRGTLFLHALGVHPWASVCKGVFVDGIEPVAAVAAVDAFEGRVGGENGFSSPSGTSPLGFDGENRSILNRHRRLSVVATATRLRHRPGVAGCDDARGVLSQTTKAMFSQDWLVPPATHRGFNGRRPLDCLYCAWWLRFEWRSHRVGDLASDRDDHDLLVAAVWSRHRHPERFDAGHDVQLFIPRLRCRYIYYRQAGG